MLRTTTLIGIYSGRTEFFVVKRQQDNNRGLFVKEDAVALHRSYIRYNKQRKSRSLRRIEQKEP